MFDCIHEESDTTRLGVTRVEFRMDYSPSGMKKPQAIRTRFESTLSKTQNENEVVNFSYISCEVLVQFEWLKTRDSFEIYEKFT